MKPSAHNANRKHRERPSTRRGFTTPAVGIALLVVMGGLALVLDRLWLDSVDLELTTAAEAAALAAADELASDEQLKAKPDPERQREAARAAGSWIALQNRVAGEPVELDSEPGADIRLGRLVLDAEAGQVRFEESDDAPCTAVVTARRTRKTNNPVGLFVAGVTGQLYGDVVSRVEAAVDNRIRGVRPQEGAPVPAYPLAIWKHDPAGQREDTWSVQIEARKGPDEFGYDPVGRRVYRGTDGIPEITLRSQPRGQSGVQSNVFVLDLGTRLNDQKLQRQFVTGWTVDDLASVGGEIAWPGTLSLRASPELRHGDRESLSELVGEPRLCLLYSIAESQGPNEYRVTCDDLVAIRVLEVRDLTDGACELVAQPCVVKTKTALLTEEPQYETESVRPVSPYNNATAGTEAGTADTARRGSPYVYKLHLTH